MPHLYRRLRIHILFYKKSIYEKLQKRPKNETERALFQNLRNFLYKIFLAFSTSLMMSQNAPFLYEEFIRTFQWLRIFFNKITNCPPNAKGFWMLLHPISPQCPCLLSSEVALLSALHAMVRFVHHTPPHICYLADLQNESSGSRATLKSSDKWEDPLQMSFVSTVTQFVMRIYLKTRPHL